MEYKVIYSNRHSIAICINRKLEVIVRCPKRVSTQYLDELVEKKKEWIERAIQKLSVEKPKINLSADDQRLLFEKAEKILPEKVKKYCKEMNVTPTKVRVGNARSYWGCCNSKNAINFSWRLMLASEETINYVVVHELAHISYKNHGKKFWTEVGNFFPNYKEARKELVSLNKSIN